MTVLTEGEHKRAHVADLRVKAVRIAQQRVSVRNALMMGKNANISSQGKSIPPQCFHLVDYFSQVKCSLFKICTVQADKVNQFQHYISGLSAAFIGLVFIPASHSILHSFGHHTSKKVSQQP